MMSGQHLHPQGPGLFLLFVLVVIIAAIWYGIMEDRDASKRSRKR